MLERMIVDYCAPTLAKMKTGNMFNYKYTSLDELKSEVAEANEKLNEKDVFIDILKITDARALVYVYRKKMLEADLAREGVENLLRKYGYQNMVLSECFMVLKQHLRESACFPHEIGLFLGYPLEDVLGFIKHGRWYQPFCMDKSCSARSMHSRAPVPVGDDLRCRRWR